MSRVADPRQRGENHMEEFNHPNTRAEFNKAIVLGGYEPTTFKKMID